MQQAQFRFYAELNDLLAPQRRGRSSVYTFGVPPSLKDAVEACLVPHTEVDLILANGEAAASLACCEMATVQCVSGLSFATSSSTCGSATPARRRDAFRA